MAFAAPPFRKTFASLGPVAGAAVQSRLLPAAEGGLYLVGGGSDWLRRETIHRVVAHHLGRRPDAARLRRFDGLRADGGQLRGAAGTLSFGGPPILVIENGLRVVQPPESQRDLAGLFARLVSRPPPGLTLIVEWEKNPNRSRKGWKKAISGKAARGRSPGRPEIPALEGAIRERIRAGTSVVFDCDAPAEKAMPAWIRSRAADAGLRLPRGGAELLFERFGRDLRKQGNEIEKLRMYRAGESGPISLEEMESVLGGGSVRNRFRFTDSLRDGRIAEALDVLDRLLAEGESPQALLALFYRLAVQIQLVQDAVADGGRRQVPGVPSWLIPKFEGPARRLSRSELRSVLQEIARTDIRLKTGTIPPREALAALALRLAVPRGFR